MTEERYKLRAWWNSRPLAAQQCAERFCSFVNELAEFDPIFGAWLRDYQPSAKPCFPVPLGANDAETFIGKAQARYDSPPGQVWPEMGYQIFGWNSGSLAYRGHDSYIASTALSIGSFGRDEAHRNRVEISISNRRIATNAPWRASELRPLLKLVLRVWAPRELSVDCYRYQRFWPSVSDKSYEPPKIQLPPGAELIGRADQSVLLPWVGWLTYLPADLATKVTIPEDIEVERLDDGGIIATLCDEPFTIDNPVHMARARAMETAIRPVQT